MQTRYETNRLILSVCNEKAAPPICDFYNRNFAEFSKYEPLYPSAKTISYHRKNLAAEYESFSKGTFIRFYMFEKINPMKVIGTLSYRDIKKDCYECCTIGYKMDKDMRRRGFMREAILCGDWVMFNILGLNRIEATIQPNNIPSMNLLASMGYRNEGLLREKIRIEGEFKDHFLYSLLKKDYTG